MNDDAKAIWEEIIAIANGHQVTTDGFKVTQPKNAAPSKIAHSKITDPRTQASGDHGVFVSNLNSGGMIPRSGVIPKGFQSMEASFRLMAEQRSKLTRGNELCEIAGWKLYEAEGLAWAQFFVDQEMMCTFVGPDTWETLSFSAGATETFLQDMRKGSGMRRMVTDAGRFREAALAQAKANGADTPQPKDVLGDLTERAQGLLVQAASLNLTPTPTQLEAFAVRLAEIRAEQEALEARFDELRSTLDLANLAVLDAATD